LFRGQGLFKNKKNITEPAILKKSFMKLPMMNYCISFVHSFNDDLDIDSS